MHNDFRIGIDTGGTFTDFVFYQRGRIITHKIPSTPRDPSLAILQGLKDRWESASTPIIVHGTTVATNALLERKGAKIALLTTSGFEDILFIARQTRPVLYSLKSLAPKPLVQRSLCIGLKERTASGGKVLQPIMPDEIHAVIDHLKRSKIKSVAVCFIHSYANPTNEKRVQKALTRAGLHSSVSSNLLPEYREFERTTVAVVNAYLIPVVSRYLECLEKKLGEVELRIMQSNEGYISAATARSEPIRTALSGPAGGVVGAAHTAKKAGYNDIITFDMGGTSTDVSLVPGQIQRSYQSRIGEFPIRLPMIDIHTVGAGGGSIAFIDRGGALRVGPESAGAQPGPACYGQGERPTVTDANLVLGRLIPGYFLGGKMKLFPERSHQAVHTIARQIGKSVIETATGIIAVANANMEKAIRVISVERGIDPRRFALVSFGGAGGMHAAAISKSLGIQTVIIPKNAGVLSALGLLIADSVKDYSHSILKSLDACTMQELQKAVDALAQQALSDMQAEGFSPSSISIQAYLDLRYLGQSHELTLPFRDIPSLGPQFHKSHEILYAYRHPGQPIELVNLRIKAIGKSRPLKIPRFPCEEPAADAAFMHQQDLIFKNRSIGAPVYDRSSLRPGNVLQGPALVADLESTILLPPDFSLKVDAYLNILMQRKTE